MIPLACYDKTAEALAYVRAENKPYFLEFNTYRFRPHSMFDPELYRAKSEVEQWKKRCPIANFSAQLLAAGDISQAKITEFSSEIEAEMQAAIEFAEQSPLEPAAELERFVYSESGVGGGV